MLSNFFFIATNKLSLSLVDDLLPEKKIKYAIIYYVIILIIIFIK